MKNALFAKLNDEKEKSFQSLWEEYFDEENEGTDDEDYFFNH